MAKRAAGSRTHEMEHIELHMHDIVSFAVGVLFVYMFVLYVPVTNAHVAAAATTCEVAFFALGMVRVCLWASSQQKHPSQSRWTMNEPTNQRTDDGHHLLLSCALSLYMESEHMYSGYNAQTYAMSAHLNRWVLRNVLSICLLRAPLVWLCFSAYIHDTRTRSLWLLPGETCQPDSHVLQAQCREMSYG